MALADDLLQQAEHLANLDNRRPKQANLRRAISAAYYALFHLLIAACIRKFGPASPSGLGFRIGRALAHSELKEVCIPISRGSLGPILKDLMPAGFSLKMRGIAEAIVSLQEARHAADYDLEASFTRLDTLELLRQARTAFDDWRGIQNSEEATVFLSALLFAKRWNK